MKNQSVINAVNSFAKDNKVSKAKLQSFVDSILEAVPKGGRPVLNKTSQRIDKIKGLIASGLTNSVSIRAASGLDVIEYNNIVCIMKKKGMIHQIDSINTGKRGRKPGVFSLIS